ncbi:hypothetical protein KFK09_016569 [Dendrobium nobile]|uniref:Uncharacterized protein n=1 Tax=Dendrobium nobile TaxID=94219 RepID=A0A8T3AZY7_DENNO|nr:hypothetical protein KFK09_016569 [Dendrobium nobile]
MQWLCWPRLLVKIKKTTNYTPIERISLAPPPLPSTKHTHEWNPSMPSMLVEMMKTNELDACRNDEDDEGTTSIGCIGLQSNNHSVGLTRSHN